MRKRRFPDAWKISKPEAVVEDYKSLSPLFRTMRRRTDKRSAETWEEMMEVRDKKRLAVVSTMQRANKVCAKQLTHPD